MKWLLLLCFVTVDAVSEFVTNIQIPIETQIALGLNYTFDTNSFEYQPTNDTDLDFGTFDFIVIGAGAAGCVMANRLSEISDWTVLLLEAGSYPGQSTEIPAMEEVTQHSPLNWGYKSIPQTKSCLNMPEQRCRYYRGRCVGGTTILNGLVYSRGPKNAFDKLNQTVPGWSYDDVLPYFKKAEGVDLSRSWTALDDNYIGKDGPLSVATRIPLNPLTHFWYNANIEKGYQFIDINAPNAIGTSATPMMILKGVRQDTGSAYIKPILNRPTLTVSTYSYVTQVLLDGENNAYGVRFASGKQFYVANATKEVILSAGVFGSAQILLNSGIGPKEHLDQVGIPVVQNAPVGSTLRDHISYAGLYFTANYSRVNNTLFFYIEDYLRGAGTLTVPNENAAVGFYQTPIGAPGEVDIEIIVYAKDGFQDTIKNFTASVKELYWNSINETGFNLFVGTQNTRSSGTVRLKNNNFFEYPLIDPNYFSDPENLDVQTLYQGIQLTLDLALNTTTFQALGTELVKQDLPGCEQFEYLSKDYWMCAIPHFTGDIYHPVGTCPMSQSPEGGVVDPEGKVYGVQSLRVVDASIYPMVLPGHPVAQVVMMAEKLSDVVKRDHAVYES